MTWHKYPYTDYHELNLDWILEQINGALDVVKNYVLKSDFEKTVGEVSNIKQTLGNIEANVSLMNGAINQLKSDLSSAEADIQQKVDSNTLNTELNSLHDDIINQIDDECEKLSNKKTIINGEANNVNYPTTLAVYNAMGSIREYSDATFEKAANKVTSFDGVGNDTDYPSTSAVYDRITQFNSDNPQVIMFYYNKNGDSSTYEQIRSAINRYGVRALFGLHIQRDGDVFRNWAQLTRDYNHNGTRAFDFVYTDLIAQEWTIYTITTDGWSINSVAFSSGAQENLAGFKTIATINKVEV